MNILEDIWAIISSLSIVDYILYFGDYYINMFGYIVNLYFENGKMEQEDKDVFDESPLDTSKDEEFDLQNIVNIIDENPKPLVDMTAYEEEQEQKAIISYDELIKAAQAGSLSYDDEELVDDIIPVKKIQVSPMELPKLKENESVISSLELPQKEPKLEVDTEVVPSPTTAQVKLFSYEKEEAFLKALQQLSELLNDS